MQILLVEDSPEVSLITVEYLVELGHQVAAVESAELALDRVSKQSFDVVMTDVSLPGMSGIELAKRLIATYPQLPIVIASGYGSLSSDVLKNHYQRSVLVLPKPYDLALLEQTLSEAAALTTRI